MKMRTMRTLRRQATRAPRNIRRRALDQSDGVPESEQTPEAVFDRCTGPYGGRFSAFDEET